MKYAIYLLLLSLTLPVSADLSDADLNKIRLIIKEEVKTELAPIKADIGKLKQDVARLEAQMTGVEKRIEGVDARIDMLLAFMIGILALIAVAIGLPAWQNRKDRLLEKRIETLTHQIDTLKENL